MFPCRGQHSQTQSGRVPAPVRLAVCKAVYVPVVKAVIRPSAAAGRMIAEDPRKFVSLSSVGLVFAKGR